MNKSQKNKVFVGLSGGVDSSVTALLLKKKGYDVTGVYMKNWSKSLPGFHCPWREDYQDAKRVAVQLGIPFELFDFEVEYFDKVVQYMLEEFKAGLTPNPDVMCNQEVKFKLFLDMCLDKGADYIATGHYANTEKGKLLKAVDESKDQTYFLYRLKAEALKHTLFPLGNLKKTEVRELAKNAGLITAAKKESMGICFVGKVGIKDFLLHELGPQAPGEIIDQNGQILGSHDGAIFYTIGQRHGLGVGAGLPYYVIGKSMDKNQVYVTTDLNDGNLWSKQLNLTDVHWINSEPVDGNKVQVRTRHRAPLVAGTLQVASSDKDSALNTLQVALNSEIRALTPGQSAVLYDGDHVLGGGIII
ncbi:MAG: tRNA 2-thiouridine(34) synthase MnmA [bacterium]|nr:tRNA 2-thiouridine(34) synthase MnmA [bacterium]